MDKNVLKINLYYIFPLMCAAFWLLVCFSLFSDFFKSIYAMELGRWILAAVLWVLPEPHGDEDWFYGLFLGFTVYYLVALIEVTAIFLLIRWLVRRFKRTGRDSGRVTQNGKVPREDDHEQN